MNNLVTRRGRAKINRWGALELARNPDAINGADVGTVTVSDSGVTIDIPALDPAWAALRLVWKARNADGDLLRFSFPVPLVEGVQGLGTADDVQGPLASLSPAYELQVVDASGNIGFSSGLVPPDFEETELTPPQVANVVISGDGHTGASHSVSFNVDGNPAPTIAYAWKLDGGSTLSTSSTYSPSSAGTLTCTVTATNSEGEAEATSPGVAIVAYAAPVVGSVSISGSGTTGTVHAASYTMSVAGNPEPTIAYQWELGGSPISGATASTYTPPTSGDLTVVVTATNSEGSDDLESAIKTISSTPANVAPDITAASITGGSAAGSTHGLSVTVIGTPAPTLSYQWKLDGTNASGATLATYTSPPDSTKVLTCTITASNVAGMDIFTTEGITLVPVVPPALIDTDWDFQVSTPSLGVTQLDTIRIKAIRGATAAQWTNTASPDAEAEANGEFETMNLIGTSGEWQTWAVPDVFKPGSGARNFRQYNPSVYTGDTARSGRLSVRYKTVSGVWALRSAVKSVPLGGTVLVNGDWLPLHHRTEAQYIGDGTSLAPKPTPAGGGYQFMRSWANSPADPDYLFTGQDISIPQHSKDFGGWWEHPPMNGLKTGVSVQCCSIDSQDAKRILTLYSAGSLRGPETNLNGWDQHSGMYLSTDQGANFVLAKAIPGLGGSATNDADETTTRYMQHCIVEVPGGTPATREIWAAVHIMHKDATTKQTLVIKSVNGGASWTDENVLSAATYGLPLVMRRAANGHWWLGTSTGMFKSTTTPAGTWTNVTSTTNLPDGYIYEMDVAGATGEVWAAVGARNVGSYSSANHGLWKTTSGGTGASSWTKVLAYNITTFAISPHDRQKILIAGHKAVKPRRSTNGGTSWTTLEDSGASRAIIPMAGQPEGFEHRIQDTHAYFVWHKADPDRVFAARFQHHGWSTDAGATFNWRSSNFDYNHIHAFNCHPTDYKKVLMAVTDRVQMYTDNGHKWVYDDGMDADAKDLVNAKLTASAGNHLGAGRGALILVNGARTAMFGALGDKPNTSNRAIFRSTTAGSSPIGANTLITSQYNQFANYGILDPTNNARGYLGRTRLTLASDDSVAEGDMTKECVGIDASGRVFGIDKGTGNAIIYRTANPTAGTPTWSTWATLGQEPRPIDNDPRGISWDPTSANGKILAACKTRVELAENGSVRTVFTVSDYSFGSTWPSNQPYSTALDPFNPNVAYVSLNRYGGPCVFKTTNLDAATPTWSDITGDFCPKCPLKLFIHPLTGDLIVGYHSGTFIYPAHTKQAGKSYYDDTWAIVSQYQL